MCNQNFVIPLINCFTPDLQGERNSDFANTHFFMFQPFSLMKGVSFKS